MSYEKSREEPLIASVNVISMKNPLPKTSTSFFKWKVISSPLSCLPGRPGGRIMSKRNSYCPLVRWPETN
ncbi:hypothetical protein EON65_56700 [archaeon]|nr:MAG: hypothetical protein EON65_56700 [archaeon]